RGDTGARRRDHVGNISAARISQRRDFIDVDAEPNHPAPEATRAGEPIHRCAFTGADFGEGMNFSACPACTKRAIPMLMVNRHNAPYSPDNFVPLPLPAQLISDGTKLPIVAEPSRNHYTWYESLSPSSFRSISSARTSNESRRSRSTNRFIVTFEAEDE